MRLGGDARKQRFQNSPRIQLLFWVLLGFVFLGFFFLCVCFICPFRLCRAADGHDRPDQGAESQPGHPLLGVQTVRHTHVLPQGEKAYFSPLLSDSDWHADNTICLNGVLIFFFSPYMSHFTFPTACNIQAKNSPWNFLNIH